MKTFQVVDRAAGPFERRVELRIRDGHHLTVVELTLQEEHDLYQALRRRRCQVCAQPLLDAAQRCGGTCDSCVQVGRPGPAAGVAHWTRTELLAGQDHEIAAGKHPRNLVTVARCSCGWSRLADSRSRAQAAARQHRQQTQATTTERRQST